MWRVFKHMDVSDISFRQILLHRWRCKVPGKEHHTVKYGICAPDNFQKKLSRKAALEKVQLPNRFIKTYFAQIPQRTSTEVRTCARATFSSGTGGTHFSKILSRLRYRSKSSKNPAILS